MSEMFAYSTSLPAVRSGRSQIIQRLANNPIVSTYNFRAMGFFHASHFWNNAPMPISTFARGLEVELGLAKTPLTFYRASKASTKIAG